MALVPFPSVPVFAPDSLAACSGGRWTVRPSAPLAGFAFDTRKLQAGDVFVALKTEQRDGHAFLASAHGAGAGAALVAEPNAALALPQLVVRDPLTAFQAIAREHRRAFPRPVVGISGSAGKTSTKELLGLLLGGAPSGVVATEGNLNNQIGVPLTLTRLDAAIHRFAVIEAGISAPGEMAPLGAMIEPDVAIITLIAPAHTEELGGIEGVAREKALLAASTRAGGVAIFGRATAEFAAFRDLAVSTLMVARIDAGGAVQTGPDRALFSCTHGREATAVDLAYGTHAVRRFIFRRVSDGMAENAVLAICAALRLGVSPDLIQTRLVDWKPAKLRGEIRHIDGRLVYLDCYNANPASMRDALAAFEAIAPSGEPRLFVLGCMEELGAESAAHHRSLGRTLQLRAQDQVFVIGTRAHEVSAGLLERGDFNRQVQIISSLGAVSAFLADWRGSVFVKGSRRYQLEKILEVPTSLPLSC